MYELVLSMRKDEDYAVNQPQMEKLVALVDFFTEVAAQSTGFVEPEISSPKELHGGVTATFIVFDVTGENVARFCDVLRHCSAVSIDATDDGVCISCTVPNVFIKRKDLLH